MYSRTIRDREPIAIVGIGCRFPGGADSPDALWNLLCNKTDAITEIPPDRWNIPGFYDADFGKPGRTYAKWGGFVPDIDHFDPTAFGISSREASRIDPQQRLMLEVAWESMEDAGLPVLAPHPRRIGVFVGISGLDFTILQNFGGEFRDTDPYIATGSTLSIAANRISYEFNLIGPSFVVDTACSSALTALNQACRAIWNGDAEAAIAGGVNVILLPAAYIAFSAINMLSPTGRCRAFDARANGFVRGEGAGAVVLKPLSSALAEGDRIYALVRGTGVNQDGRTNGMTVPSRVSQESLLREVCADAGVDPATIQYMEAHGTGTPVGDPIEASAIGAVFGAGRPAGDFCRLGSIKTNIGHLEAASGIAGVIKAALTLHHGVIPPNLHFEAPNPDIDFARFHLRVVTEPECYGPGQRLAGVNSFGFGGANAFALLQDAATATNGRRKAGGASVQSSSGKEGGADSEPPPHLFVLSSRTPDGLRAAAEKWAAFLYGTKSPLDSICHGAATRRATFDERLAVVGASALDIATNLSAFAQGGSAPALVRGATGNDTRVVFVFSGQGPQWWGMGRELWHAEPIFRQAIEDCHQALLAAGGWSLKDELFRAEEESRMAETAIAQPAITALQIALARLWQSWGIHPCAVVGHSVGEVAAAHVAGVLSLDDSMRVIYHRGRCMDRVPARGKMIAAGITPAEALKYIRPYGDKLSLAAVNSPHSVSLSGDAATVDALAAEIAATGAFMRYVPVNYAFHSGQMDPVRDELLASLQGLKGSPECLPIYSTVTGRAAKGLDFGTEYWWLNVRQTVNFASAIQEIANAGYPNFLEIAAHPVLSGPVQECLGSGHAGKVLPSLRRKAPERATMLGSLGTLHTIGASVAWDRLSSEPPVVVTLPSYAWQRQPFWLEPTEAQEYRLHKPAHPLFTQRFRAPDPAWSVTLDRRIAPWINDHRVQGHVVYPAAGHVELGLVTARELHGAGALQLEDVELSKAIFLTAGGEAGHVQFTHALDDNSYRIHSRSGGATSPWSMHSAGKHRAIPHRLPAAVESVEQIRRRCPNETIHEAFYDCFRAQGLEFGPAFQGVQRIWWGEAEALGEIAATKPIAAELDRYEFHPALLDSCLQVTAGALFHRTGGEKRLMLPISMDRVRLFRRPEGNLWAHARLLRIGSQSVSTDILITNAVGEMVAEIRGMQLHAVEGTGETPRHTVHDLLYEMEWQLAPRATPAYEPSSPKSLFPAVTEMRDRLPAETLALREETGLRLHYAETYPDMRQLCAAYVRRGLIRLGWRPAPGEKVAATELLSRLGLLPRYRFLIARLLKALAEDGFLRATGDGNGWEVVRAFGGEADVDDEISRRRRKVFDGFPGLMPMLTLLERCGGQLAEVLRGEVEAVALMMPQGSLNLLEWIYADSFLLRIHNLMAERIMADVARRLPEGRVLRVLEIGAGTGGLTGFVVPSLPPHQTKYVFTDLSRYFFSSAEQRFRDYTFIEYETLDIERDPVSQGFPRHGFDVVLASNVFHAASDLAHVLRYTRQLLAKDGLLVIIELEIDDRWLDLTFGLTEGWWRFSDHDLRPDSPLLTRATWETTLAANGFGETVVLSDSTEAERNLMRNITLLTRATGDDGSADATTDSAAPAPATATWLIFDDENGTARRIGRLLAERGDRTLFVRPTGAYACRTEHEFEIDPASRTDMAQLLHALSGPLTPSGVIYAWPLRVMSEDFTPLSLAAAELFTGHAPLHLVQSLTEGDRTASPQLWILTRCAQPAGATDVNVGQAPMVGLGRTITNEMPRLRCRLVDLGAEDSDTEIRTLIEDLLACDDEEEIALRGEARYVPRLLRRADRLAHVPKPVVSGNEAPWRLAAPRSGAINQLAFQPMQRRVPGPDDVEIEVHAAGLNFRDVMKALGIHPGDAGDALVLGDECAGRVTLVGGNVTHVKPGDAVMAIGAGCFASHLTLPKDFVTPKPAYLSFEEAATMQLVHLTSFYALHHLGRMKAGEKVLIHAAAGGVGLAAIQLAQATGAEVFATAGSQEKRDFLHTLGVEHVMDSRALDFADEILDITGGNGIDLVLNSIAGEAIAKSLSVLGPCGRFLEIGKRDIYGNTHIGLRPFRNNLSYFAIDLSKLMDPAFIGELLQPLFRLFDQRKLRPLPYRAFPVNASADAFRYMTQARQIGKIVITPYGGRVPLDVPPNEHPVKPNDHATYLVVGGAGGFGLAAAHWLVSRGARHVVLASRSASPDAAGRAAIASMEAAGAHVMLMQCDVTSEEDVARILVEIAASGHPLRGVIHSAMVLDDALLSQLDADRFRRVTSPKIHGAWNLHRLTRDLPLDFFVLFSSSSVTIGNPGQGSYCAANAFLDALAHHRRRLGLPGLAVNWGLLAEVGIITRDAELADHFRRMGIEGLPTAAAFDALSLLLSRHATQTTVWNMNWSGWFASGTHVTKAKRFVKLVDASATTTPGDEGSNLREALRAARMEDRMELMQNYLRRQISEILRVPAAKLDLAMPLNVQGMDSLMAVELIHRLESQLGASLTDAALALRPTIVDLSGSLLESIGIPYAKAEADASASAASSEETERVAGDAAARS